MEEIRIKLSNADFADLKNRSNAAGFNSVNTFVRNLLFPQQNYPQKQAELKAYIASLKSGDVFYVRDAVPNPPALLGRWAYEQQKNLGIELAGKDRTGTNQWRKK